MAAGANPVLITRGIEKTTKALVAELKSISKEVIYPTSLILYNLVIRFSLILVIEFGIVGGR